MIQYTIKQINQVKFFFLFVYRNGIHWKRKGVWAFNIEFWVLTFAVKIWDHLNEDSLKLRNAIFLSKINCITQMESTFIKQGVYIYAKNGC